MCLLIRRQIRSEISSPHLRLTSPRIDPSKRTPKMPKTPKRKIGSPLVSVGVTGGRVGLTTPQNSPVYAATFLTGSIGLECLH